MADKDELARIRGEMLGMEVVLMHCLCFIAVHDENPSHYLERFGDAAIDGVLRFEGAGIPPRQLKQFRNAATEIVLHCVRAAQDVVAGVDQRARRLDETS